MATYQVMIEGQIIPVPEEIGSDDEKVLQALAPFYPEVANAGITRSEKDGVITVTVIKKAGSKGLEALEYLITCEGGKNPAVALLEEIQGLQGQKIGPFELLEMDSRIQQALEEGSSQANAVAYAAQRLAQAQPRPSLICMAGF
jgi:hypothetical protein